MDIFHVSVHLVKLPLKRTVRHASYARREVEHIVVRVELDDGTEGFGEGAPREYVTGETAEDGFRLLRSRSLHRFLSFLRPRSFEQAVEAIAEMPWEYPPDDDRRCFGNAARCAMELALLDAYGQYFGRPLSLVTAIIAPTLYSPLSEVRYSGAITDMVGWKLKAAALAMRVNGFRHLKVKVGIAGQDEVERLKTVRRWCGKNMEIRVDANEAWSPEEVVSRVQALEPYQLAAVEQPVRHEARQVLAQVRRQVSIPIMLDESVCSFVDAQRALAEQTCDLFNLRISKCGGFIPTLRIALWAREHGIGYQLGCQVGETAILSAAGRHFACSVSGLRWVEGSYDRYLLWETLSRHDLTFGWGGWAPALQQPGLGLPINREALKRCTVRREEIFDITNSAAFDVGS